MGLTLPMVSVWSTPEGRAGSAQPERHEPRADEQRRGGFGNRAHEKRADYGVPGSCVCPVLKGDGHVRIGRDAVDSGCLDAADTG